MTATEELRRMLDERGVEWWSEDDPEELTYYFVTKWFANAQEQTYEEIPAIRSKSLKAFCVSPEQAIAATLGSGECEAIYDKSYHKGIHGYCEGLKCSNCENPLFIAFYYCPWCGARIRKAVKR